MLCVLVTQSCPALCDPMDCSPPGSSAHTFSRQEYWSGLPCPSPVFLTQGWNPGLLHCRQILYHLCHQRSPLGFLYLTEWLMDAERLYVITSHPKLKKTCLCLPMMNACICHGYVTNVIIYQLLPRNNWNLKLAGCMPSRFNV